MKWIKDSYNNYREWENLNDFGKRQIKRFEAALAYSVIAGILIGLKILRDYFGVDIDNLLPEQKTFIGMVRTFWPVVVCMFVTGAIGSYLYVFYMYISKVLTKEEAIKFSIVSKAPESWF